MKTLRRRNRRHRRTRKRSHRRQRGGAVVTEYLGGMPVTNKRNPTLVFRSTDLEDPHGSPSALFSLPYAFERSQDAGP